MNLETEQRLQLFSHHQPSLMNDDDVGDIRLVPPSADRPSAKLSLNSSSVVLRIPQKHQQVVIQLQQQQQKQQQFLLQTVRHWMNQMEQELYQLERDDVLGPAIVRACQEIANGIAVHLLNNDNHNNSNSNNNNMRGGVRVVSVDGATTTTRTTTTATQKQLLVHQLEQQQQQQQQPSSCSSVWMDLEEAFRSIDIHDANEIADTAITVGQLVVATIQHVVRQQQQEQQQLGAAVESSHRSTGVGVQLLLRNDDNDDHDTTGNAHVPIPTDGNMLLSTTTTPLYQQQQQQQQQQQRVRCIWPPIRPITDDIIHWTRDEVIQKQPLYLTVPIFVAGFPIIATTAIVGSTMIVTDHIVQSIYHRIQNHPIVVTGEIGMASVVQTLKLGYLTTKIIAKPSVRIVQKQIQRHVVVVTRGGGGGGGSDDDGSSNVTLQNSIPLLIGYHVSHPIATLQSTLETVTWCSQQTFDFVVHHVQKWQQQRSQNSNNTTSNTNCGQPNRNNNYNTDDLFSAVSGPMADLDDVTTTRLLQNMSL